MNRFGVVQFTKALLVLCWVVFGAAAQGAEQNKYQEACQTFGGTYEETQKGCDPNCVTTYACKFADGTGRACDDKGKCGPIGSMATGAAASTSGSSTASSSGSDAAQCADSGHDKCEDQCSGKQGREALDCVRSCLSDACGDIFGASGGGSGDAGSSAAGGCRAECPQKCDDHRRREKRRCILDCERQCSGN